MSDCLFCKIVEGEIPADLVYQDDDVIAFNDLNPQAPTHILIIPRKHISTVNDASDDDALVLGKLMLAARKIAHDKHFANDGYRLVVNCNQLAGQTVFHIHMHLLAEREMSWPPG